MRHPPRLMVASCSRIIRSAARFDHESLAVEMLRCFHDHDDPVDPFSEDSPALAPGKLIQELSFYLETQRRCLHTVAEAGHPRHFSFYCYVPHAEQFSQRPMSATS
jgi:hypothetical protein